MQIDAEAKKSEVVYKSLRDALISKNLRPGMRLRSVREMCKSFQVSSSVIDMAYDRLEKEGYIIRKHGSGTYVLDKTVQDFRIFALFSNCSQQTFEGYYDFLLQTFTEHGDIIIPQVISEWIHWEDVIDRILKLKPYGCLVDLPQHNIAFSRLKKHLNGTPVCFINRWEWDEPYPERGVLVDYKTITVQSLKRFQMHGHKRTVFLGHEANIYSFKEKLLKAAAKEAGVKLYTPEFDYVSIADFEKNPARLKRVFGGKEKPTAIFAHADNVLPTFLDHLKKIYPDLPEMEMTGCYDTHWSRMPGRCFPSYKLDFNHIWNSAYMKFSEETPADRLLEWHIPRLVEHKPSSK